jgi:RND family efflux transporter MFP subunit
MNKAITLVASGSVAVKADGMNKAITLVALVSMAILLSACSEGPASKTKGPAASASKTEAPADARAERKILYWKSAMDPTFVSKSPGKDKMGMDLMPVYEGAESQDPAEAVRIDPATVQNIGVTTAVVERKRLTREVRTVGRIDYDETTVRHIAPKIGGWIEAQHVNFAGQVVQRGEPLLEIYSPELVATQEEYLIALRYQNVLSESSLKDSLAGADDIVRAAETRLRYWNITDRQIKALRERGELTRTMVLYAPFRGIIVERNIPEGGFLEPGQTVYSIADLSTIWVYADIYEYEAPWLMIGQKATMTLAYEPGKTYRGAVTYVYPYLNNKTRTIEVRMEFPNTSDLHLKIDMWANVVLKSEVAREGLAIPIQAVMRTGQRNVAIIALGGGRFEPRDIQLGAQAGDEFEVLDGLAEGDQIVTSANFLINSESNLGAARRKMLSANAPATPPKNAEGATQEQAPAAEPSKGTPAAGQPGRGQE